MNSLRLHALAWAAGGRHYRLDTDPLVVAPRAVAVVVAEDAAATELANVIVGLALPTHGTVRLDDKDVTGKPAGRPGVGLVPVDGGLLPHRTIERNITAGRRDRTRPETVASTFHLGDVLTAYPHTVSPAQRLRAAVARAVYRRPAPDAIVIEDRAGRTPCGAAVATALAQNLAVLVVTDDQDHVSTLGATIHHAARVVPAGAVAGAGEPGVEEDGAREEQVKRAQREEQEERAQRGEQGERAGGTGGAG